jgi:hypothetical protein
VPTTGTPVTPAAARLLAAGAACGGKGKAAPYPLSGGRSYLKPAAKGAADVRLADSTRRRVQFSPARDAAHPAGGPREHRGGEGGPAGRRRPPHAPGVRPPRRVRTAPPRPRQLRPPGRAGPGAVRGGRDRGWGVRLGDLESVAARQPLAQEGRWHLRSDVPPRHRRPEDVRELAGRARWAAQNPYYLVHRQEWHVLRAVNRLRKEAGPPLLPKEGIRLKRRSVKPFETPDPGDSSETRSGRPSGKRRAPYWRSAGWWS